MRSFMIVLLAAAAVSIATAMTSTNQTQNISDIPNDFFQGINLALPINVTPEALDNCEQNYKMAVYITGQFSKYLFVSWGVDFALIHGILGMSFEGFLEDWKDACENVAYQYDNYFEKAIYAYQENKEAFFETVEANFDSNEIVIIEAGISIASLIKAGNYSNAGYEFGLVLKVLLSQWLPTN